LAASAYMDEEGSGLVLFLAPRTSRVVKAIYVPCLCTFVRVVP